MLAIEGAKPVNEIDLLFSSVFFTILKIFSLKVTLDSKSRLDQRWCIRLYNINNFGRILKPNTSELLPVNCDC